MAATYSRSHGNFPRPAKTFPVTMPTKISKPHNAPVSRVAMSPPELDDASTVYSRGGRSGGTFSDISDTTSSRGPGIDVMDELTDQFSRMRDSTKMDRNIVKQAQTSGQLNAKQRELAELQALASQRVRSSKVKFTQVMEDAQEAQANLKHIKKETARMQAGVSKANPEVYDEVRRSRQSRR